MDYKQWFDQFKRPGIYSMDVETMYQAFKARMLDEMKPVESQIINRINDSAPLLDGSGIYEMAKWIGGGWVGGCFPCPSEKGEPK